MAGLSSPGIGSGLDINGLVTKLMAAESQPLKALDKKEAAYQSKLTAYGTLKGALSSLQTSVRSLNSTSKFNTMKATAADATIATATTTTAAKAATYKLEVTTLAQAQKLAATAVSDPTASVGTGTLTIDFGTYTSGTNTFVANQNKTAKSITIDATNSSLNGIRDAINSSSAGVTASIVNDGGGYRLVLTSNDSGADNSMRIVVDEGVGGTNTDTDGLSKLAFDPTAAVGSGENLTVTSEAKSAVFKLDGITMTKSSNTVSDAITGVTLSLLKTNVDTPTTLTVSRDTSGVKSAVEGFVKAYNELAKTIKELGGYDAETKKGGVLLGDAGLRSIQDQMRQTIGQQLGTQSSAGLSALSDIGVSFQRDGTLDLNTTKLSSVLADSTKNVGALFATVGTTSDSLVSYVSAESSAKAGTYGIKVTTVPARGYVEGSGVADTVIDDDNHTLTLSIDGSAKTITLDNATYTADTLVAHLQTKINTAYASSGKSVTVTHTGGKLTITSAKYGASSSVQITGGGNIGELFGVATSHSGQDVAGEIGGVAATGSGQILTGVGNAAFQVSVDGGITGERGSVTYSQGIAYKLDTLLQSFLDKKGTVASRTDGINSSVKDLDRQRSALEARLVQVEKRYRAQFNSLDQLVASMQQTSSYLQQQLATISAQTNNS